MAKLAALRSVAAEYLAHGFAAPPQQPADERCQQDGIAQRDRGDERERKPASGSSGDSQPGAAAPVSASCVGSPEQSTTSPMDSH